MRKRLAVVDVGSNTIKVNITDYLGNGRFEKVLYQDFPSGLGNSLNPENVMNIDQLQSCFSALQAISKIMREQRVEEFEVVATHALREAVNQKEVLAMIKAQTNIDVVVLPGEEEAKLTLKAVLIDVDAAKNFVVINAGGGSTELSFHGIEERTRDQFYFFRFGAVNLQADFLRDNTDLKKGSGRISAFIRAELEKAALPSLPVDQVVSMGGSIYNAAFILRKDDHRNFDQLSDQRMSVVDLEQVIRQLQAGGASNQTLTGMDADRADTTLPGVLIHLTILEFLRKDSLVISTRSISDGLIYSMTESFDS